MRRSLLLLILILSLLLTACSIDKEAKIIEKIEKKYDDISYEVELEMRIIGKDKESLYRMKEIFVGDDEFYLEILEPMESKGITIEYKDDKLFLNHANIRQSLSLKEVKNFDKGILLASFYEHLESIENIELLEIEGKDYYKIKYRPEGHNRYNFQRHMYLSKKKLEPYMMEVLDEEGNIRVVIKYYDFTIKDDK
ncbi:MAG: hypothetical protein GX185_03465 [Tissierellia bacterium]|nr:hypothetical protein [Tissierellia bacterium]